MTRQWMTPGAYLRQCRKAEKISQRELAERVGVCHVFVSMIERGVRWFPLDRLEDFDRALLHFDPREMERFCPYADLSHRWGHEWEAVAWLAEAAQSRENVAAWMADNLPADLQIAGAEAQAMRFPL